MVLPTIVQANSTTAIRRSQVASHEFVIPSQLLAACGIFSTYRMEAPIFHVVCVVTFFGESGIGPPAENICRKLGSASFNNKSQVFDWTHIWGNAAF
jgi:hypothetical protein